MKVWIYLDGRQQGPFEMEDLKAVDGLDRNTKVWFEGLEKWSPAGEVRELLWLFGDENDCQEPTDGTCEPCETEQMQPLAQEPEPASTSRYAPGRVYRAVQLDEPCPPTYLGWSIFLMICCCSPVSLGALAASICVSSFYGKGDLEKSKKASEWAAWLVMISIALGMIPSMMMSAFLG